MLNLIELLESLQLLHFYCNKNSIMQMLVLEYTYVNKLILGELFELVMVLYFVCVSSS